MTVSLKRFIVAGGMALVLAGCLPYEPINPELVNGDFELSYDTGWRNDYEGTGPGIEQSDTLGQPDSGQAVRIAHSGLGNARLWQIVSIGDVQHEFGFTARFRIGGSLSCVPIASVILTYIDRYDRQLGSTRWYLAAPDCTWRNSATCHLIPVDSLQWSRYRLDIQDEIAGHLPGIRAGDVRRVQVEFRAETESEG